MPFSILRDMRLQRVPIFAVEKLQADTGQHVHGRSVHPMTKYGLVSNILQLSGSEDKNLPKYILLYLPWNVACETRRLLPSVRKQQCLATFVRRLIRRFLRCGL